VKQQKETKQPRHENGIEYILQAYLWLLYFLCSEMILML
jgi:hypothetical protein